MFENFLEACGKWNIESNKIYTDAYAIEDEPPEGWVPPPSNITADEKEQLLKKLNIPE